MLNAAITSFLSRGYSYIGMYPENEPQPGPIPMIMPQHSTPPPADMMAHAPEYVLASRGSRAGEPFDQVPISQPRHAAGVEQAAQFALPRACRSNGHGSVPPQSGCVSPRLQVVPGADGNYPSLSRKTA